MTTSAVSPPVRLVAIDSVAASLRGDDAGSSSIAGAVGPGPGSAAAAAAGGRRAEALFGLGASLRRIALGGRGSGGRPVAVLCVNQVTDLVEPRREEEGGAGGGMGGGTGVGGGGGGRSGGGGAARGLGPQGWWTSGGRAVIPALGLAWSHGPHLRLFLSIEARPGDDDDLDAGGGDGDGGNGRPARTPRPPVPTRTRRLEIAMCPFLPVGRGVDVVVTAEAGLVGRPGSTAVSLPLGPAPGVPLRLGL